MVWLYALLVVSWFAAGVVTALKGKWGMLALGLFINILWVVGAVRIAKPDSWWARRFYDDGKLAVAQARVGR